MYDLLLTCVLAVWGLNYVVIKVGLRELDAGVFTLARFLGATPIMFALVRWFGEDLRRSDWPRMAAVGLVGITAYQTMFAAALRHTTAANVSLLLALSPAFTVLMGWLTGRDRPTRLTVAGTVVAFAGAALVITAGPAAQVGFTLGTLKGDLLGLGAGFLWAAYAVIAEPLLVRYSGTKVTAYAGLVGAAGLAVLYGAGAVRTPWADLAPVTWGAVGYNALLSTAFGLVAFYHSIAKLGPTRVMAYMYLAPFTAIVAAALLLGERLTWPQVVGAACSLGGIWLVRQGGRRRAAADAA